MKLLAIDGNSILNRAFYGIRPLTTSKGFNTNAIYGFLNILNKHLKEEAPCRVAVAFDLKAPTYRHKIYKEYKAGRKPMPEELHEQFPVLKEILDAMGIIRIEQEGLEADDILGILSKQCSDKGEECILITGDRDSFQLIDKNVTVKLATTKQGGSEYDIFTPDAIYEKYGLYPSSLIDLKALMGDSSDNIPGIPGVGEKTALSLLKEYGDLETVLNSTEKLKGALKTKVENGKESARLSKKLGTIIRESDLLKIKEEDIPEPKFNKKELLHLFAEYELSRMIKIYGLDGEEESEDKKEQAKVNAIETEDLTCLNQDELYILATDENLTVNTNDGVSIIKITDEVFKKLNGKNIVTHDAKPLLKRFLEKGYSFNIVFDTMLAAYILNPSLSAYPLSVIISESTDFVAEGTAEQCALLKQAKEVLEKKLEENGQQNLYYNIELPLCGVLANMENDGFEADEEFLKNFGLKLDEEIADCTNAIFLCAGHEFNINSPKQLGTVLFEELQLPSIKKTKTGYSTNNEVLETLNEKYDEPILKFIIEYRKLSKLKSTYVDGLIKCIDKDGRIHSVFTQTVTQTGRISSIEPNLQNIPVRTELGRQLRKAFRAKNGCTLLDADYSQIELRVLAHIADDENMKKAFLENRDIHTATAAQVFGLPEEMVTEDLRRKAKAVNFGIVYGIGEYSLSKDIGVSFKEAKNYIENYFKTYSGVKSYMDGIIASAKEKGYVETMFARRRYVPDINAKNKQLQAFASRVCRNTPIQGTAADLIKLAMVKVFNELEKSGTGARLILQIHDELIIEVPDEYLDKVREILKTQMEHAQTLSVPLIVDIGQGHTWYESK